MPQKKLNLLFSLLFLALGQILTAQVTLTHNVGDIVPSELFSCSPSYMGRIFTLQDFGIAEDEEFVINSAEIAYQIRVEMELGAWVAFYVYAIDDNFPTSFYQATLLGNSQLVQLETSPTNNGLTPLKMLTVNFNNPVTVPPNTTRILVEVEERLTPNSFYLASTEDETDSSWFRGGCPPYTHNTTDNYGYPDTHFYLKVFGNNRIPSGCSDYPLSYDQNTCDIDGDGIGQFDSTYWGNALRWAGEISYFDAQGSPLPSPLPNPYTNTTPFREVISVRATDPLTGNCLEMKRVLTTYDPPIDIEQPPNLYACDEGNGYAHFDVSSIETQIIGSQTGINTSYLNISYMDADGQELIGFPSTSYRNQNPYSQTVYVRVTFDEPFRPLCPQETTFDLVVRPGPQARPLNDLVIRDDDGDGFAEFDTSGVESAVVGSQTGMQVSYFDAQESPLPYPLPNPYTNMVPHLEIITVRVTDPITDCFTETPLTLRVSNTPVVTRPPNLYTCDEGNGYAHFDVSSIEAQIIGSQTGLNVSYLDANGQELTNFPSASYRNQNPYSQTVTARVTDENNPIFQTEVTFTLNVNLPPVVHALPDLIVCGDDGFAEFDTSGIEGTVVGNRTGLEVSYFNAQEAPLPYPLPNPYTNTVRHLEIITVRVTDPLTDCYAETPLTLQVSGTPHAGRLPDLYACDEGNGYAHFDVSSIEAQIIGSQTGLNVSYLDADGQELTGFPAASYKNQNPHSQTITIRVADSNNPNCYSETSFDLVVIRPPTTDLQQTYYLCELQPSMTVSASPGADFWTWITDYGTVLSESSEVVLTEEGYYTLVMGSTQYGVSCESSTSFRLVHTPSPTIQQVNTGEDFSDDNYIEILASGSEELEYSIDGERYQDHNVFRDLPGGIYTVHIRDRQGCGENSKEVVLLDYPKFFTPNNDGVNDHWQIKAIKDFPDAVIHIFDRYGKQLGQIRSNDTGWDGTFGGSPMPSSDYWFQLNLGNGREYRNHFTLKR
ncbi:T9SS type B sorting domain-containing protein [Spongiimicrobium sp. 3-5]|uniref:T9SS type B sorting domain-containing protein n=1 Tax=Spongiimicrobium sp. 3-5 TaxID=3332596 RepID=UPI00398104C0